MEQQLAEDPPADRLLQLYFVGMKWWSPPERGGGAGAPQDADQAEAWECPYPDRTE